MAPLPIPPQIRVSTLCSCRMCQRAMAAAVGADDFCFDDVSVFDVVNFKEFVSSVERCRCPDK
ncbi:MAG: hypothetical protein ACLRXQ_01315 [Phascolarctobacterium faecium]